MSIISTESQRLLDDVSLKSTSVLHKLQLNVDSDMIRQVWFSFGIKTLKILKN